MTRLLSVLFAAALFLFAAPARAFTPESGWWWNPAEPGYGFSIEIQDDFIFMVAFSYEDGQATWYAAQGEMADNAFFTAPLYRRDNGTCLGCPFVPPSSTYAVGSNVTLEFLTETKANLTWGGRTIPLERHDYYLSRNPAIDPKTELWLGEWQIVLDLTNVDDAENFPFYGEVLVFDAIDTGGAPGDDLFIGCRPENSLVGLCDQFAYDNHDAAGYYCPGCGINGIDVHFIVVKDSVAQNDEQLYFVFEVETGTYQFDGNAKLCFEDDVINGRAIQHCVDNDDYPVIYARGWRSASRAFIEGDDDAPNAQPGSVKAGAAARQVGKRPWTDWSLKTASDAPNVSHHRPNAVRAAAKLQSAMERLGADKRRTAR